MHIVIESRDEVSVYRLGLVTQVSEGLQPHLGFFVSRIRLLCKCLLVKLQHLNVLAAERILGENKTEVSKNGQIRSLFFSHSRYPLREYTKDRGEGYPAA